MTCLPVHFTQFFKIFFFNDHSIFLTDVFFSCVRFLSINSLNNKNFPNTQRIWLLYFTTSTAEALCRACYLHLYIWFWLLMSTLNLGSFNIKMQHLVTRYGDHLLQSIQQFSKQLDLSLDGVAAIEANNNFKAYTTPKNPKDLPPAKYSAWKMWQEDGLSAEKIAVRLWLLIKKW